MSIISEPQRSELYKKVKHVLGAPLRSIELEEEQMDTLLEFSIDEYSQYVQDWLTESQWTNLYNLNMDTQSLSKAFTTRSLDYETRYTYAYSKIVGLQAGGDSVLKKDFIQLVPNQQIYEIPENRELNELLWFTPATLNSSMFGAGFGFGEFGGGTSEYLGQGEKDGFGNAARFFYCAKANKRDRNEGCDEFQERQVVTFATANGTSGKPSSISEGRDTKNRNHHPTVKPTDLMQYLCRLITPPNGTILDPFLGSGSTGKAAMYEGFNFVGIELTEEYLPIAKARIEFALANLDEKLF
jgi:DNA modification methylase